MLWVRWSAYLLLQLVLFLCWRVCRASSVVGALAVRLEMVRRLFSFFLSQRRWFSVCDGGGAGDTESGSQREKERREKKRKRKKKLKEKQKEEIGEEEKGKEEVQHKL